MKKTLAFVTCAGLGLILAGAFVLSSRHAKAAAPTGPDLEATAKPEPVVRALSPC